MSYKELMERAGFVVPTRSRRGAQQHPIPVLPPVPVSKAFRNTSSQPSPILLRQIIAGGAARTPERATLVSTKPGMIEQQPAAK
jgi:hypothetical protein